MEHISYEMVNKQANCEVDNSGTSHEVATECRHVCVTGGTFSNSRPAPYRPAPYREVVTSNSDFIVFRLCNADAVIVRYD